MSRLSRSGTMPFVRTPDHADANVIPSAHELNAVATVWMLISYPEEIFFLLNLLLI